MIVQIDNDNWGKIVCSPVGCEIGAIVKIEFKDKDGTNRQQLGYIIKILED